MPSSIVNGEGTEELRKNFLALKEAIFSRRPVLRDIITKHGSKSLYRYGQDYLDVNLNPVILGRQAEFLETFKGEVSRILGDEIANSAVMQLKKYYFVNTSDHHGPVCHPFFLNSNLLIANSYVGHDDPVLKNIIVLSCANVSLNNSSFPRGLIFNSLSEDKQSSKIHRLSFLPSTAHNSAVYNFRPYTEKDIAKINSFINEKATQKEISSEVAEKLSTVIKNVYNAPEIFKAHCFSDQVTVTNYSLWKMFFNGSTVEHPNLIYIEQESLVKKLLVKHHLFKKTIINDMLFSEQLAPLIDKYFEGIMGAFSKAEGWGTYFFWGLTGKKDCRLHLWRDGKRLVSKDGSFSLELTPEAIHQALLDNQIIPSMLLIFLLLSFYYGLKCLGGVNQVNYLTLMKEAFIKFQTEVGNLDSVEACARIQTKEFVDGPTVAMLAGAKGKLIPATGLDLILYGNQNTWKNIVDYAHTVTLEEAFNPLLPEYYPVMYAEVDRMPELSHITLEEIGVLTGLAKKIQPCASMV